MKYSNLLLILCLSSTISLAGERAAMDISKDPTDLGNQSKLLMKIEGRSEFKLSWRREEFTDYAVWSKQARAKVLDLLHYCPAPADPSPETVERTDMGDYIREKVHFNTTPDIRVPAYVLIPKSIQPPFPAIVALHDHGAMYYWGKEKIVATEADSHPVLAEFKKKYYGGSSYTTDLVKAGYLVVAIDMLYWGERKTDFRLVSHLKDRMAGEPGSVDYVKTHNQLSMEHIETLARGIYAAGATYAGIMAWDDIRTVDYLLGRGDVDPSRIGCIGLSVGAFRTNFLTAFDPRVKAAVAVCWMTTFREAFPHNVYNTIGWMKMIPGMHEYLDLPDMMALAIPRPYLVIEGQQDGLFPRKGVEAAFDKIRRAYEKAGCPDHFKASSHNTPHEFNREMQAEALAWFKKWL